MFKRLLAAIAGIAALAAAFVLASVVLAVVAVAGLVGWGWLWWRTRELRAGMDATVRADLEAALRQRASGDKGAVIEGEYREISPDRTLIGRDDGR